MLSFFAFQYCFEIMMTELVADFDADLAGDPTRDLI